MSKRPNGKVNFTFGRISADEKEKDDSVAYTNTNHDLKGVAFAAPPSSSVPSSNAQLAAGETSCSSHIAQPHPPQPSAAAAPAAASSPPAAMKPPPQPLSPGAALTAATVDRHLPLDDTVLLRLLLRSVLYAVPWGKPEEERLSEGIYTPEDRLEVAKAMIPCLDLDLWDAAVELIKAEDPIVSLKVLFNAANQFREMQIAPPEPYYDGSNWRDPEKRNRRIKDFYREVKRRSEWRFQDDTAKKEDSWKVWNFVQSGAALSKAPARDDLMSFNDVDDDDDHNVAQHRSDDDDNDDDDDGEHDEGGEENDDDDGGRRRGGGGAASRTGVFATARALGATLSSTAPPTVSGLGATAAALDSTEPDAQFLGGTLSSCFGGDLVVRVHALRWTGKATNDTKTASALPARAQCAFQFCINTRPQWEQEQTLVNMPTRQLRYPNSVIDYDASLEERGMLASATQENWNRNSNLAELVKKSSGGVSEILSAGAASAAAAAGGNGKTGRDGVAVDEKGLPILEELPVKDVRPPPSARPAGGGGKGGGGKGSNNSRFNTTTCHYWDFHEELFHLPFGDVPIKVDFADLAFSVRTPPGCCSFGSDEVCSLRIPLSALYIDVLALNSVNRKRRFRSQGAEGVHCVFRWFDCTVSPKFAKKHPSLAQSGTFSMCVSMHLRCRCKSHNRPLFPWNPFTDPQFDVHKGQCRINADTDGMQQVWAEPLHRYFIHLIENFHPRREDIELNVVENFHDMFCLDPQFLFVWTLRTELFAGKLYLPDDRASIRSAAARLAALVDNVSQLNTYDTEKFVLDTKKHAVARFLAVPTALEELFGADDERIIQANEGLMLAQHVLKVFGVEDLEQSIIEAAKRDVSAFFVVASDSIREISLRFPAHCQDVLKDFSLCFQHMKKAIKFGLRVKKVEEQIEKQRAKKATATTSPTTAANSGINGHKLTCSRVIYIRMQTMARDVCQRLRVAISNIHVAGASSTTVGRPEAISPLMQLIASATDCADQLTALGLDKTGHELEGIVPQTFLPMFLSLARERLHPPHNLVRSLVRKFALEPAQPGRVQATPAATDAFQFIRATFDDFVEVARACDIETVLICLGSLLNYLIEATDVFVSELTGWDKELEATSNPIDSELEQADRAGMCLAHFQRALAAFERALTLHATLCSFHRLLDDFWSDDSTRDFIENLDAAITHVNDTSKKKAQEEREKEKMKDKGSRKQQKAAAAAAAEAEEPASIEEESEHQVFQAKSNMVEALNSSTLPLEISMMDMVMPAALRLPHEFAVWAQDPTHAVRAESEIADQQADIAGATANCVRRVFRSVVHRGDRSVLRSRLCVVAVRGAISNLLNCLVLDGDMMTAKNDLNLRLQRGIMSHVVNTAREEMEEMCMAAGGPSLWQTAAPLVAELDTALGVGLMSSTQLVAMLAHIRVTPQAQWDADQRNNSSSDGGGGAGSGKKPGHRRQVSGAGRILISRERYEKILKRACVARALCGDDICTEYAADVQMPEFVEVTGSPTTA